MPPVKPKYQTIADRDVNYDNNENEGGSVIDDISTDSILVKKKKKETTTTTTAPPHQFEVIILDFTHARFTVQLPEGPTSTVRDLKAAGSRHHSVQPHQQRLIYQGKLLADENATLQDCGIHNGSIVHLFPKPRVVVVTTANNTNSNNNHNSSRNQQGATPSSTDNESTADQQQQGRVPTIVLDETEHARRGQILVLGSPDYLEAVNNVKLFSFMLLIISTIELLNLVAVALGEGDPSSLTKDAIPYNEHDDFFPSDDDTVSPGNTNSGTNTNNNNDTNPTANALDPYANPYQTWTSLSWVDLVVSVLGIYVALLGIRASNDNVLAVARLYLVGTAITGMGWLVYNFIINFEIDEMQREREQQPGRDPHPSMPMNNSNNNNDSVFNQAVQAMVLPAVVWGLCIFRAWQFQNLLAEAEQEAMDRVQSEEEEEESDDEEQALQTMSTTTTTTAPRSMS